MEEFKTLILDDGTDLFTLIPDIIKEIGYDYTVIKELDDIENHKESDLIILGDTALIEQEKISMIRDSGIKIPIICITSDIDYITNNPSIKVDIDGIIYKPITDRELRSFIELIRKSSLSENDIVRFNIQNFGKMMVFTNMINKE